MNKDSFSGYEGYYREGHIECFIFCICTLIQNGHHAAARLLFNASQYTKNELLSFCNLNNDKEILLKLLE